MENWWRTIEIECWSRSLSYSDYLSKHLMYKDSIGAPLTEKAYISLCTLMQNMMEEHLTGEK